MKVENSGVVMIGLCDVQTSKCSAKTSPSPITAVWTEPSRMQINVCRNCMEEKLRTEEWEMPNVRLPFYLDIAVTIRNTILLAVEVKKSPLFLKDLEKKAIAVKENFLIKKTLPNQPFFMVIFVPGDAYLWLPNNVNQLDVGPDYTIECKQELENIISHISEFDEEKYEDFEKVAHMWLKDKIDAQEPDSWVLDLLDKYNAETNHVRVNLQYKVS